MKKIHSMLLMIFTIIFGICGCAIRRDSAAFDANEQTIEEPQGLDYSFDNFKELYSNVLSTVLEVEKPIEELDCGGEGIYLGAGKAFRFKKHLFEDYKASYDEVIIVDSEGVKSSVKCPLDDQIMVTGYAVNSGGFLLKGNSYGRQSLTDMVFINFCHSLTEELHLKPKIL